MRRFIGFAISEIGRIILSLAFFIVAFVLEKFNLPIAPFCLYLIALLIAGIPVFVDAVRGLVRRDLLDEKFLMSIASIGAMFVGEMSEGVAVMVFFLIGEYFEHKAVKRSRKSIRALMDIRPDEACVLIDGEEIVTDVDEVSVGSLIIIRPGERVPLDCRVISGFADVDTSALTGESIPVSVAEHTELGSGSVIINGVVTAQTLREAGDSAAARILDLVENANERKSKTENFITAFSHYYTPIVVILAFLIAIIPSVFGIMELGDAIYRALIFLVISCPCALVISVPMAFFGGIGAAASKGILYKGGNTFSALSRADVFAFDKTGTLTNGEFSVGEIKAFGVSEKELCEIAASVEYASKHPIARCLATLSENKTLPAESTEIAGKGMSAIIGGIRVLVGNAALLSDNGIDVSEIIKDAGAVHVARDGKYIGSFIIFDKIRPEAEGAIYSIKTLGAKRTVMLSGDKKERAIAIGNQIGIDNIYAELSPEEKFLTLEEIKKESKGTVYVGDGINDSPALAVSDVGIAMGAIGSDSAIEAADVVIMSDNLSRLPTAVRIARKTTRIAKQNIVFALSLKLLIMILGAFGIANMWLAVFADVGVAVIAILNSMRTLRIKNA